MPLDTQHTEIDEIDDRQRIDEIRARGDDGLSIDDSVYVGLELEPAEANPGLDDVDAEDSDEPEPHDGGDDVAERDASLGGTGLATAARRPLTALPQVLAAPASAARAWGPIEGEAPKEVGRHSAEGKAARIQQLIADGKGEQAMTLVHSILREQARRQVRRAEKARARTGNPGDPHYFLTTEWRAQWSGQDVVGICRTIAKGVAKSDTSGTAVVDAWRSRVLIILMQESDLTRAADVIANAIVIKERTRNDANRRTLCDGLTELQVQVAQLLGADPREWVHPIQASTSLDEPPLSETVAVEASSDAAQSNDGTTRSAPNGAEETPGSVPADMNQEAHPS